MRKTIAARISTVILTMIALSTLAVGVVGYVMYRRDAVKQGGERALDIAKSAAAAIDAKAMQQSLDTLQRDEGYNATKAILDSIIRETGVQYLYVLEATPNSDNQMVYYMEGYDPINNADAEFVLGDTEDMTCYDEELDRFVDVYDEQMFAAINSGQPTISEVYDSGDYGSMVSGFIPIMDGDKVVGIVGVDIITQDVMLAANRFGMLMVPAALASLLIFGLISVRMINRMVGKPIRELTEASYAMSEGRSDVRLDIERTDEIGKLADSFRSMLENTRNQVALLERLAAGDLNVSAKIRNEGDAINIAIDGMVTRLDGMLRSVLDRAGQVAFASEEMSSAADSLAESTTRQSSLLEEFSETIRQVYEQTEKNASQAADGMEKTKDSRTLMHESNKLMDEMCQSMHAINDSSERISQVIKVIEDIAFQTNILALNASVEAARAGQQGKGFAVVAEEVRSLAGRSAAAAKETAELIKGSGSRVAEGSRIAGNTGESLRKADNISIESAGIMEQLNYASREQSTAINEMNSRISDITSDVHHSSAVAQQSAASAQQMSELANELRSIVSKFNLRDRNIA